MAKGLTKEQERLAGLFLGYQKDPVQFFLQVLGIPDERLWSKPRQIAQSVADNQFTIVPASHAVSKALDIDTPILTPYGFVRIGDIGPGVVVYGEQGQECEVLGVSPVTERECYRVTFDDGAEIVACDEHLWSVHDFVTRQSLRRHKEGYRDSWGRCSVVSTKWMADHMLHGRQNNLSIPVARPIVGDEELPGAYTIGFWLGDGTRGGGEVTIGNVDADEVLGRIQRDGYAARCQPSQDQPGCKCYTILGLQGRLRSFGILRDKHFRPAWLRLCVRDKLELLRGYMDADGYRLGNGKSAAVGTTDKRLYDSLVSFVASLGNKVFCGTETINYRGNPKTVYKLNFTPVDQPFCLARKRLTNGTSRYRHDARMVLKCEPVGRRPVRCIRVDNPAGLFLAGNHLVPTHNTWVAGRIVTWFKVCFQPSLVLTTAPTENQVKNQLWREIRSAIQGARVTLPGALATTHWDMSPTDKELDSAGIPRDAREGFAKNYATGFSTTPDSAAEHSTKMQGFHNKHFLAVLDEGCGLLPQIWNTVMLSLIIDSNCKVLALGNPTDPESEFAAACRLNGRLDHLETSSEPYWSDQGWRVIPVSVYDTPNYQTGKDAISGVAGRKYVETVERKCKRGSNQWLIRVRGAFPSTKEGTYYGQELATAFREKRVGEYRWDPSYKVYRFADFGDSFTAAIDAQYIRGRWRIINDYWDNDGVASAHGGTVEIDARGALGCARSMQAMPYVWGGEHFAGPDLEGSNRNSFSASGTTTKDVLRGLGFNFKGVDVLSFAEGIEAVRFLWPLLDIDEKGAATFLRAMKEYSKVKNESLSTEDQPAYHDQPRKNWARHMADALRHMAIAYRRMSIDGEYLGDNTLVAKWHEMQQQEEGSGVSWDPMKFV